MKEYRRWAGCLQTGRWKEAAFSATHHFRASGRLCLVDCVTLANDVLWVVPSQEHVGAVDASDSDIVWRSGDWTERHKDSVKASWVPSVCAD